MSNHDVAWLLWLAERVLAGRDLYGDLIEINPPLAIWLAVPSVAVGQLLGSSAALCYHLFVVFALAGCTALLLTLTPDARGRTAAALILVLIGLAAADFGQREHLAVGLLLPLLAVASARASGRPPRRLVSLAAGALAGLAISLKPFLAPLWVMVVWRRRPSLEDAVILATGAGYVVAVLLLTPGYLSTVGVAGPAYYRLNFLPLSSLITMRESLIAGATILAALWVRGRPPAVDILLIATLGGWLSALLQHKGWNYHWYPAVAFGTLTCLAVLPLLRRPALRLALALGLAVVLGVRLQRVVERLSLRARDVAVVAQAVHPCDAVLLLSRELTDGWPGVTASGARWAGRLPSLWHLNVFGLREPSGMSPAEHLLFNAVVRDLAQTPDRILFEARDGLDLKAYFEQDSTARRLLGR
ncbi:MAG TPA: hypothetical protein VFT84_01190, partial [Gemmatimonadales bacterium]|nr:hypothetical protein [Gemmatimonadales bacterium]